jgi:ATP-binding cassette subfamily B (MDR/TAP) protein 1
MSLQYIADGGNLAEEVIGTVRTAQAFGTQKILGGLYDIHVDKALVVELKSSMWHGGGLAFFFFVIYASYALAFHFGTTLIIQGHGKLVHTLLADYPTH